MWCRFLVLFVAFSAHAETLWLGATHTLDDSGFLDYLVPKFEAETGIEVHIVAQATGQVLRSARDGHFDALIVHHPPSELEFVAQGYASSRVPFMQSSFVLVGPKADPAGVMGLEVDEAFQLLSKQKPVFITRNDASGTYFKEMEIWSRNELDLDLSWRLETGQGMGVSLNIANAMGGYVLSELASFVAFNNRGNLMVVAAGGKGLENFYSILIPSDSINLDRSGATATTFANWLLTPATQKAIADFDIKGESPFRSLGEREDVQ